MALNVTKCVVMSFKRGTSILDSQYSLRGIPLKRVCSFKDLGVTMTQSLSPLDHISVITGEARSLLGFIFRSTRDFSSPESLLVLFRALVLPVLEYGSIIWAPYHLYQINLLQSVQRRFVRMLSCRMGFKYFEVPVEEIKGHFHLLPLVLRWEHNDLVLLFKTVNGYLDCPELLASINICVPRGMCSRFHFSQMLSHNSLCL
ncbi:uncharacterized protein LOC120349106 [Nilaparvata lugens]|uniref:uncharacterized protein LOC120349106 n=1 Tax=Nilaparvata lugens TaxID=108931 RepID=UPI00193D681C|nr:uncharacterized protein LOC120349106 [Nilaparvata lugens]